MRNLVSVILVLMLSACAGQPTWEGMSETEIAGWRDINVSVEDVHKYMDAKMTSQDVQGWQEQGFTQASEIIAWASKRFSAADAKGWKGAGFSLEQAVDWAKNKFSFSEASNWQLAGFDLDDAIDNRAKGLTPVK